MCCVLHSIGVIDDGEITITKKQRRIPTSSPDFKYKCEWEREIYLPIIHLQLHFNQIHFEEMRITTKSLATMENYIKFIRD